VTDRQTDRQNYDPQDRASIAASRGKKESKFNVFTLVNHSKKTKGDNNLFAVFRVDVITKLIL